MILRIPKLLDADALKVVRDCLETRATFIDGAETAGPIAAGVKRNLQARPDGSLAEARHAVETALRTNVVFTAAALPKKVVRLMFNRYDVGMEYGLHVDNAVIDGGRTDLSFTVFLSDLDSYEGGALALSEGEGERVVRLAAGDMLLYPADTLHRVRPVTAGSRLAAVGWVRSLVRDVGRRAVLFDLEHALRTLHAKGEADALDRVNRARNNLMRLWVED